jgi:hypothetical protein
MRLKYLFLGFFLSVAFANVAVAQTQKPSKSKTAVREEFKQDYSDLDIWDRLAGFATGGFSFGSREEPLYMGNFGIGYKIIPKSLTVGGIYTIGSSVERGIKFNSIGGFGRYLLANMYVSSLFAQGEIVVENRSYIGQYVNGQTVPLSTESSLGLHLGLGYSFHLSDEIHTDSYIFYNINGDAQPISFRWGLSYNF